MSRNELLLNSDYEPFSATKDNYPVIDKRTGEKLLVSKDEYQNCEYYVSRKTKKIEICDSSHKTIYAIWGDFDEVCEINNLPKKMLWESFKNNGKPLDYPSTKDGRTRFINRGFETYLGWYAKKA